MAIDLTKVDYELLQQVVSSGKSKALSPELNAYLDILDVARSMYAKYQSKRAIINTLMAPVYGYSRYDANLIFNDAMNFFYVNNDIKKQAWKNFYADRCDELALLAIEKDEFENARRLIKDAATYRGLFDEDKDELPADMFRRSLVIYTMDPQDVGIQRESRSKLAQFIDSLDEITEEEKSKLKRDAMVERPNFFQDLNENEYEEIN